ncbi:MAG: NAD-dependent epimerase/dehydratase family protein, partial [Candidatus Brocadiae bacterium]|nr:NAD-dependent epimerase/dehydratase family protein [Candidatus Brocadiia bacterium]
MGGEDELRRAGAHHGGGGHEGGGGRGVEGGEARAPGPGALRPPGCRPPAGGHENEREGSRVSYWQDKRVVVTGGAGFLGSFVVEQLEQKGPLEVFVPRSADYDLRDRDAIVRMYEDSRPNVVLHLAASCGGIGVNRSSPASFFYDNAVMGIQLIEQGRLHEVEKFVIIGTVCAYPKFTPVPFR